VAGLAIAVLAAVPIDDGVPRIPQVVTSADLQRLQDELDDLRSRHERLRGEQAQRADQLEPTLERLEEDLIYLRVKLRREGAVTRADFQRLEREINDLEYRLGSHEGATSPDPHIESVPANTVPVGTELDVRLQTRLDTDETQVEDRFTATSVAPLYSNGEVLIPAGSVVRGTVASVDESSRLDRDASMTLSFEEITVRGQTYPVNMTLTEALESEGIKGEAERIGIGAAAGGIIGGILGGLKGVITGVVIGAGGTVLATEGEDVELPPGTILRVRFDSPVTMRPAQ